MLSQVTGSYHIGFFLAVIFRLVKIRFAVTVSNLPVFRFVVIFIIFKTTRFFIYRYFRYSINLPVYSVSRYIYPFSICLDVVFCSTRGDSNRSKTLIFNMKLTLKNHNYICRYCCKATRFFISRFFSIYPFLPFAVFFAVAKKNGKFLICSFFG